MEERTLSMVGVNGEELYPRGPESEKQKKFREGVFPGGFFDGPIITFYLNLSPMAKDIPISIFNSSNFPTSLINASYYCSATMCECQTNQMPSRS